jgi:hypothetical protein
MSIRVVVEFPPWFLVRWNKVTSPNVAHGDTYHRKLLIPLKFVNIVNYHPTDGRLVNNAGYTSGNTLTVLCFLNPMKDGCLTPSQLYGFFRWKSLFVAILEHSKALKSVHQNSTVISSASIPAFFPNAND